MSTSIKSSIAVIQARNQAAIVDYAMLARDHVLSACTDKIVPRKTVVYETLVDPTVIKVAGERLKRQLFVRFGFLKSKSVPIELVSMEKYYEPYIVVTSRYFLDYYRICTYDISIDNDVAEVILLNQKFYPEKTENATSSLRLEGEERLVVEKKGFFMLAGDGREVNLTSLPSAPSERHPERMITKFGIKEVDPEADIDFVRRRMVHRPENLSRIVTEIFEISERVVIYAPRFKLTYVNADTYKQKSIEFDGVTSKVIRQENFRSKVSKLFRLVKPVKSVLKPVSKLSQKN